MHTIQLKINDKVYDKFLWLLSKFDKEEIEIIAYDQNYLSTRKYLQKELEEIDSGKATFYTQQDLDDKLNQIVNRHENNL